MPHLTVHQRELFPESDFAVPGKRLLPINDATHIRLAHDMLDRTAGLTDEERKEARRRIAERAAEMGIDTTAWTKITAAVIGLQAMSLDVPDTQGHPNKHPFKGILTRIDQPSDAPPNGSGGRLVLLTRAAAEAALPTLLGMAIDCTADLSSHSDTHKIGIITAANIVGDAVEIEGFFYAQNFPAEMAAIQKNKNRLGFSFELNPTAYEIAAGNIFQVNACVFTGAALLYRDKAAYQTTSLAAAIQQESAMTAEELKKMQDDMAALTSRVAAAEAENKTLKTQLEANATVMGKVEPHAKALESCAADMEAAGIGCDPKRGHAAVLKRMAGSMRASAALGNMPAIYRDHDYFVDASATTQTDPAVTKQIADLQASLDAATTQIADLKAGKRENAEAPERKTISAATTMLLERHGIKPQGADGAILAGADLDNALKSVTDPEQRMAIKRSLERVQLGLPA